MGLATTGFIFIIVGVLLSHFPHVFGAIGGRMLEIEQAKNLKGESATRTRSIVAAVITGVGAILVVAGIFNQ